MHPVIAHPQRWRWYFVAWAIAGLSLGLTIRGLVDGGWIATVAFGLPMGLVAGSVSLSAWYVCRALPATRTPAARLAVTSLLAAVVSAAIWAAMGQIWWRALGWIGFELPTPIPPAVVPFLLVMGGLTYLIAEMAYYVWQAYEESSSAGRRALQSEIAERDAELRALRAQVDPHFLFNSLNSVAGLIGSDPARARVMCQLLGDFLRDSMTLGRAPRIPLGREVALAQQYLGVEQVRFGARLAVEVEVGDDTVGVMVPPLLLQPLVENAVRHGIATLIEGGAIALHARRAGARVVVVVSNPRDADRATRGTGLGLDLVRRRLDATFGDQAALVVEPRAGSYRVSMTLPADT